MLIQMMGGVMDLNNGSPLDMVAQILASGSAKEMINGISAMVLNGARIDNYEFTVLNDMNIAINVNNIYAAIQTMNAMNEARRNGADEATISQFAESLNDIVQYKMNVKKLGIELPAKMVAAKVGVEYTVMPAVSFDGKEYTPVTELVDIQSIGYIMNIVNMNPLSSAVTAFGIIAGNLIKFFTLQSQEEEPAEE
jgi:hypothetical protein